MKIFRRVLDQLVQQLQRRRIGHPFQLVECKHAGFPVGLDRTQQNRDQTLPEF